MTKSKTDVTILSDEQISEIEARLKSWTMSGGQYPASWNDVSALCQTVRALRAENERLINECERWKRRATAQTVRNGEMLSDFTKALKKL